MSGLTESRDAQEARIAELVRHSEELHSDNRRMAELLATSEGETQEVANVIERLTQEKKELLKQCQDLKKNGEIHTVSFLHTVM